MNVLAGNRTSFVGHLTLGLLLGTLSDNRSSTLVVDGEQSFFPVYEPTQEELKARYKAAEGGPMVDHYDAKKEGPCLNTSHVRVDVENPI